MLSTAQLAPHPSGLLATLFVGVSGRSFVALGDTLFRRHLCARRLRADFSANSAWLLRIRWLHPTLGLLPALYLLANFLRRVEWKKSQIGDWRCGSALRCNMRSAQPTSFCCSTWMQIVHLLGADVLWIALIVLTASPVHCADWLHRGSGSA